MLCFHQLWAVSAGSRESLLLWAEWVQHLHSPHLTLPCPVLPQHQFSSNQLLFPGCFPAQYIHLLLSAPPTLSPAHGAPETPVPLKAAAVLREI